ncbi:hypothetical protein HanRHA438_Chr01g0044001 [Helianthus annuus]|nr:hypothetical protein HanRHA438_Chr01g0044001 [Helianthus annuus]
MFKLWRWYQNCLSVHPVKTQVISSGLIWGFGDIAAQTVTHASSVKRNPNLASRKHVTEYNHQRTENCAKVF